MQCEQRKRKSADQGLDGDVDAVELFKNFHSSRKNGLRGAARDVVVSDLICFP